MRLLKTHSAACMNPFRKTPARLPVVPEHAGTRTSCAKIPLLLVLFTLLPLLCTGCRLGYVIKAGYGQFSLLNGSYPLGQLREEGRLPPDHIKQALLIQDIRRFGEEQLGLEKTNNYETVYVRGERDPIYVLSAAPKDKLTLKTWWFPIVGRMPYLGFFEIDDARAAQMEMHQQGMDVSLRTATAYSTLGWFQDPITPNLFLLRPAALAQTNLHELTHVTLYAKGQGEFNEGLAMLVGLVGGRMFCEDRWGKDHPETTYAASRIHDEALFSRYVDRMYKRIEALYDSDIPRAQKLEQRPEVFRSVKEEFNRMQSRFQTDRFHSFGQVELNNAYILSVVLYHRPYSSFQSLYEKCERDIKTVLHVCRRLAEQETDGSLMELVHAFGEDAIE